MKRIMFALSTVVTAAAITFGSVAPSYAANGVFIYHNAAGRQITLDNPLSDKCLTIEGAGRAFNGTDDVVLLYPHAGCLGHPEHIKPGENGVNLDFGSVLFAD
ncbi:hypothetical protein FRZ03_28655 [Streptomyces misionensis]|uniref:Uncharacterized protein n=1 Tax=Streptomyces misionensis TaxID=67331 RepID=A0A5C6IZ45_9ACTN|nr:hypothetical protein [Streptomyces misionensis]TWV34389.1 hypothetical protein FRZ03_28655 [Streptomyces misionensis]